MESVIWQTRRRACVCASYVVWNQPYPAFLSLDYFSMADNVSDHFYFNLIIKAVGEML